MEKSHEIQWKSSVADGRETLSATIPCGPYFSAEIRHNKPHSFREQDIFVHSTAAVIVEPTKYQITRYMTRTGISEFSIELATAKLLEGVMSVFRQANSYPQDLHAWLRQSFYSDHAVFQDAMRRATAPVYIPANSPDAQQILNHSEGEDFR